ncbi:VOC family protein [Candidatus Micrarchaeota archaeon]|nr:VOC family protein [Candidatus Micrarchaeota archaeon]
MEFRKLTPNLMVKDVSKSAEFYTAILGFTLEMAVRKGTQEVSKSLEDGEGYAYAMVRRGGAFIMLMEKNAFLEDLPLFGECEIGASASFYFDVDDADALFDSLKGKVEISLGPLDTWYGMREFYVKDCDGYVLGFASRIPQD